MIKVFKYSLIAVQSELEDSTFEVHFENSFVLHEADQIMVEVNHKSIPVEIATITRVNHIDTPNVAYDYRVVGITR